MELKEFITQTLIQISEGVKESIEPVRQSGGYTNPAVNTSPRKTDESHFGNIDGTNIFLIDFNVAITVEENTGIDAAAKLNVASLLSLGAAGVSENKNSITNQIAFKVPLTLPVDPITYEEYLEREKNRQRGSATFERID